MKNKYIMACILFIAIGFAVVTTTLVINGNVLVGSNNNDFDIYFSKFEVNGEEKNGFILDDKHIFINKTYKSIGDKDILKYYITNGSSNYDARVSMNCNNGDSILKITNSWVDGTIVEAKDTVSGELSVELLKVTDEVTNIPVQCTISVDAIEKTSTVNSDVPDKVEKLFELVDDKNNNNFADIGDEIAIGDEHFYIISNDDGKYKALAKYNLYVGYDLDLIMFDEGITDNNYDEFIDYVHSLGFNSYSYYSFVNCNDDNTDIKCRMYEKNDRFGMYTLSKVDTDSEYYNKQYNLAIGAHGGEYGSPEFPQRGILSFDRGYYVIDINDSNYYYGFSDYDANNFWEHGTSGLVFTLKDYLDNYIVYLQEDNKFVSDISILSLTDINDIVKNITNKELPLNEWGTKTLEKQDGLSTDKISIIGDLKEYLSDEYEFLWDTTYWISTLLTSYIHLQSDGTYTSSDNLFVDTLGNICNGSICVSLIGAGIRPVITIGY